MTPTQIKALRTKMKLSQAEFASRIGLRTKGAVSLLESGKRKPTGPLAELLKTLAKHGK